MASSIIELYVDVPADRQANIFGQFDEHLKLIERTLNVTMIFRDGSLKILGSQEGATQARAIVEELNTLAGRGNTITQQNVNYALSLAMEKIGSVMEEIDKLSTNKLVGYDWEVSHSTSREFLGMEEADQTQDPRTEGLCGTDP